MFDPIDTPDGGNIGIHKHMAITAYITQGVSREPMIKWLREKVEMKLLLIGQVCLSHQEIKSVPLYYKKNWHALYQALVSRDRL